MSIAALTYNTTFIQLRVIAFIASFALLAVSCYITIKNNKYLLYDIRKNCWILFTIVIYILGFVRTPTNIGLKHLCQLVISITIMHVFTHLNLICINKKYIIFLISMQSIVLCIPMLIGAGWAPLGYASIYSTTTFLGIYSCILCEIVFIFKESYHKRYYCFFAIIVLSYLCWLSKTRTALIGILLLIILLVTGSMFYRIQRMRRLGYFMKWVFFALGLTFVIIYPNLSYFSFYEFLSTFVYDTTGKILMSGRNLIWHDAFQIIHENWLFGYGLDYFQPSGFIESIHNSYLNLFLQGGIIQLSSVLFLINKSLNRILDNMDKEKYICFCCCLVNLLISLLENMLFEGQLILQVLIWTILGLGMNISFKEGTYIG